MSCSYPERTCFYPPASKQASPALLGSVVPYVPRTTGARYRCRHVRLLEVFSVVSCNATSFWFWPLVKYFLEAGGWGEAGVQHPGHDTQGGSWVRGIFCYEKHLLPSKKQRDQTPALARTIKPDCRRTRLRWGALETLLPSSNWPVKGRL